MTSARGKNERQILCFRIIILVHIRLRLLFVFGVIPIDTQSMAPNDCAQVSLLVGFQRTNMVPGSNQSLLESTEHKALYFLIIVKIFWFPHPQSTRMETKILNYHNVWL